MTVSSPAQENKDPLISNRYRNYVLFILTCVYVFNFIDRQIIVILQESIKRDLGLSDTQLGLMTGFTFAIFYASFGIPIARLADKSNRKIIIAVSLVIWSGMTAVSGMAQNFLQLLLARIGVGIGEAGGSPPAHSIISDLFPPKKRATALAIYSSGISIGVLIGFLLGGWIDAYYGWRNAFFIVGIPGILLALILYFTVKEPLRGLHENKKAAEGSLSFKAAMLTLWRSKTFRYVALASGFTAYSAYAFQSWMPPFLARLHGMDSAEIGFYLSLLFGIGGGLGFFLGGFITDRASIHDKRWYLLIPAATLLLAIPFALIIFFTGNTTLTLILMAVPPFLTSFFLAPSIAVAHTLVSPAMRALASAILFFILNIIGLGCGPLFTGMLSDLLTPSLGADALRWALGSTIMAKILGAIMYLLAAKTIVAELNTLPKTQ